MRWSAETKIQPELAGKVFSRNQLMNDDAEWYLDHSQDTTDILHEYFVPRDHAGEFLAAARTIIRKHNEDLLNVTVRDVRTDHDTFLNYATQDMLAFVMFFSQPRTPDGDAEMQTMTQDLVGGVLQAGGRYYLPYRLHPTEAQFLRAQRMESIGTLAGGIAHDLNNVLAPIMMGMEMLKEKNPDPSVRHLIEIMETSANRGAAIVRQVLTFARGIEGDRVRARHVLAEGDRAFAVLSWAENLAAKACSNGCAWRTSGEPLSTDWPTTKLATCRP